MANLTEADVTPLQVVTNTLNLRKDLHLFVEYMQEREVKRAYRTNWLPKADSRRLAKLMSDPDALTEIQQNGYADWIDFVDSLALKLGFVNYDTEGSYAGYSSVEPTFADNYIFVKDTRYEAFLEESLAKQEAMLLQVMIDDYKYDNNEFIRGSIFGQLDSFSSWGCATGVMPTLNFASVRRTLFDVLCKFPSGVWYTTASLVAYLKKKMPYFLIPKRPRNNRRGKTTRYGNFREQEARWGHHGEAIPDDAPDGFERVEGRYVERFLEGIPLSLGYLDVAYSKEKEQTEYPAINRLQAFRLHEHFLQMMYKRLPAPQVIVQPNFEIKVDSVFYPATVLAKLKPLSKVISNDTIITLKLQKKKVAQQLIEDQSLNVIALLTEFSDRRLPQNIVIELKEWAGHSEKFTLYDGFGILEADKKVIKAARQFIVEDIAEKIKLVRLPHKLYTQLRQAELIPLQISHGDESFEPVPEEAKTIFITKTELAKEPEPESVILKLERLISLNFPTLEIFERFCKELAHVHCPAKLDKATRTITYSIHHTTLVDTILKRLEEEYKITVQEN